MIDLPRGRRRVAMLTHSYYEEDARVRREAEALVGRGRPVTVFALRSPGAARTDTINGVAVVRLAVRRHQGAGIGTYFAEYVAFAARASLALARAHRRRRFGLVQVHSIPDFLAFAALPVKMSGVPLILDLHEAMPEFFRNRFGARYPGWLARGGIAALRAQERASIGLADVVITVNEALGDRLRALGVPAAKIVIVPNSPSLGLFDPAAQRHRRFAEDGTVRLVYAGGLSPIYELDVAVRALAELRDRRPALQTHLAVFGRDYGEVPLVTLAAQLEVADRLDLRGRIPLEEVPAAIAAADIGLAPTRRTEFTDFSLSSKVFEYAAMGKPVVASRLPMIERTFGPDTVMAYRPGDAGDLAEAVLRLVDDAPERDARIERTSALVSDLSWEQVGARYRKLVDDLVAD